ncbi:MAG: fibrinogen-like YCDxxxxGGGW domain-containing protein [Polyangiaceae bacterium]
MTLRLALRASLTAAVVASIGLAASCRAPTQIVVELRTDVPCADVRGTSLAVGPLAALEDREPVARTAACDAGSGRIGSLVIVPSGGPDEAVAIKTVLAFGRDPSECRPPDYGPGCVVARRALRFIPGQTLTVPLLLSASCSGVVCGPTQTCVGGSCTGAAVDPDTCARADGCDESSLGTPSCTTANDCESHFCADGKCALARDCAELLTATPTLPSGKYVVDVDGPGALPPMRVECDMATEGGGWTLVLNYLHKGGTNPELAVRTTSLPVLGATSLGGDESASGTSWGHASNGLMTALRFDEMRWFARSSGHTRVVDFVTRSPAALAYARTGRGTMVEVFDPRFTRGLAGRVDAALPLHVAPGDRQGFADQGERALTEYPVFGDSAIEGPRAHWGIKGRGSRWEADNFDNIVGGRSDTQHQIWVRPAPCADGVKDLGESDVDCGGACAGCDAAKACVKDSDCKSGACDASRCAATLQTSCKTLLAARPGIASGVYTIDVDGPGALAPFDAYCDMSFREGGWTMVLSTANGDGPNVSAQGAVLPRTTSHVPPAVLTALAAISSQAHLRTHATAATRSITSKPGSPPITRLGALGMLESGPSGPANVNDWTGPFADAPHLTFTCATSAGAWPSVYQACGTNGIHLWTGQGGHSRWRWSGGNRTLNEPMELFVR